jgi:hypothetical protein
MWRIKEHRDIDKTCRKLPSTVIKKYELWKNIVFRHGPAKLLEFPGFHDEKLKGDRAGQSSSRLRPAVSGHLFGEEGACYGPRSGDYAAQVLGGCMKTRKSNTYVPARAHAKVTPGEVIRMLRDLKGWTQSELADRSSISATNLSLLENDRVEIGRKRVEQLAKAFDVHPAIIMFPEYEAKEIQKAA